ncbi:MAG: MFS transporter [Tepidiformaceae bacterium]
MSERVVVAAPPLGGSAEGVGFRLRAATALASLLAPLNSTLIAVGLPVIRADFGVGVGAMTLLVSIYLVAVAVTQPVGGRLGDAFGHLRVVAAGLVLLVACSLAAALAWDFSFLLVARAVQGIAAGLVAPNATAFLYKRVPVSQLGRAMGSNGAAIASGAAVGPLLGGALLSVGDWQLLFLANVPVALAALWLTLSLAPDAGAGRRALVIDLPSLGLLAAAFSGMVLLGAASRLGNPALLAAGFLLLPTAMGLYWLRFRRTGAGVVDLRLFGSRNYAAAASGTALANLVMYSVLIAMPVYLADVRGAADHTVALLLFSTSVCMLGIGPLAGNWSDRFGRRPLILAGSLVVLGSALGLTAVLYDPPLALLAVPLVFVGVGMGITSAPQSSTALEAWPRERAGSASGSVSMMRYVGSVTGAAMIAAVLGRHPGEADFRLLFLLLSGFAVANVTASLAVRDGPRRTV